MAASTSKCTARVAHVAMMHVGAQAASRTHTWPGLPKWLPRPTFHLCLGGCLPCRGQAAVEVYEFMYQSPVYRKHIQTFWHKNTGLAYHNLHSLTRKKEHGLKMKKRECLAASQGPRMHAWPGRVISMS